MLKPGTLIGRYEIVALVGAGGMGEVYRASDSRLRRTVALKVLGRSGLAGPQQRERFEREARAIASLNHPHICTLYDVGQHDGVDYLVMEYIDGVTLATRMAQRTLRLEQALTCGIQMALALAAAHAHGIIHRDLKPSNVMLTSTGVKLLDFGIAARQPLAADNLPEGGTLPSTLTADGAFIGSIEYMAPEQLEGQAVDARSDIFSAGLILYEMTTGHRAFDAKSRASLVAAILEHDPAPLRSLQPVAPPALEHIVERCLAKRADERWQTALDLASELRWVADAAHEHTTPAGISGRRLWWWQSSALCATALAAGFGLASLRPPAPALPSSIFTEHAPPGTSLKSTGVISPNGRHLTYVTQEGPVRVLRVRALASGNAEPRVLAGTEDASNPFWSTDSAHIGFFAAGLLKRVAVSGGPPQTIVDLSTQGGSRAGLDGGAAWGTSDVIVFAPTPFSGLSQVPAAGGLPVPVTRLDTKAGEDGHGWPSFLPDGKHFVYSVGGNRPAVYVGSLNSAERTKLLDVGNRVVYAASGHLLFPQRDVLMAQPFDASRLLLTGKPFRVADSVGFFEVPANTAVSASATGVLAFVPGTAEMTRLEWFDRAGRSRGVLDGGSNLNNPDISPEGGRVVAVSGRGRDLAGPSRLWLFDLQRGVKSAISTPSASGFMPLWFPDGRSVVYSASTGGVWDLHRTAVIGDSRDELLLHDQQPTRIHDISRDGSTIVYIVNDPDTHYDIWYWRHGGKAAPVPFLRTRFDEFQPRVSPNGRWITYASNESGAFEIYVQSFPVPGAKRLVSTNGGTEPQWRRDGRELFYLSGDQTLTAVTVETADTFETSAPKPLFRTRTVGAARNHYSPTADGQRFLVVYAPEQPPSGITVVLNWTGQLVN